MWLFNRHFTFLKKKKIPNTKKQFPSKYLHILLKSCYPNISPLFDQMTLVVTMKGLNRNLEIYYQLIVYRCPQEKQ